MTRSDDRTESHVFRLTVSGLWQAPPHELRRRWARLVDIDALRARLFEALNAEASPIAYEVFNERLMLGDDDVTLVIGEAEWDTFYVAARERGGLSAISVHGSAERAVADFLGRALSQPGRSEALAARLVTRHLSEPRPN